MTQPSDDAISKAVEYMRYQGSKSFEDLKALMDRTAGEWRGVLEGLTEEQASFKPGEEWCAKEVLAHVLHSNRGINQQIAEMAGVESPNPAPKVGGMGEKAAEVEEKPIEELRGVLRDAFGETNELLTSLASSDKLDQTFPHPLFGPLNLKEWFAFHRVHAMDHIGQIDQIRSAAGFPPA